MNLALDPNTEQRIQRELDRGHYQDPAEVVARAMGLLEAQEDWLLRNKDAINARIQTSMDQIARGEGIPGDKILDVLAERRRAANSRQ